MAAPTLMALPTCTGSAACNEDYPAMIRVVRRSSSRSFSLVAVLVGTGTVAACSSTDSARPGADAGGMQTTSSVGTGSTMTAAAGAGGQGTTVSSATGTGG